jgi:hypothetical protein
MRSQPEEEAPAKKAEKAEKARINQGKTIKQA